jgi:hypothetical protein
MSRRTNLYTGTEAGYYVWPITNRVSKFMGQRRYSDGYVKSAIFYSKEEALEWLMGLPETSDWLKNLPAPYHINSSRRSLPYCPYKKGQINVMC